MQYRQQSLSYLCIYIYIYRRPRGNLTYAVLILRMSKLSAGRSGLPPTNASLQTTPPSGILQGTGPGKYDMERRLSSRDPRGGTFEHKGCFLDSKDERVLWHRMTNYDMTPMVRIRKVG